MAAARRRRGLARPPGRVGVAAAVRPSKPPSFTRWVEGPIARRIMGVTTFGTSPSGVREWYRADEYRPLASASALVEGRDAGPLVPFAQPAGFGFSEPPRRPAMVKVRPLLEDPSGRLDGVIATVGV